ncbi:MAG: hypothetical protein LBR15_05190 [Methanobrevibacter sp.]|nr:hypothetical protein [Candidatus Methanovirga australis]
MDLDRVQKIVDITFKSLFIISILIMLILMISLMFILPGTMDTLTNTSILPNS